MNNIKLWFSSFTNLVRRIHSRIDLVIILSYFLVGVVFSSADLTIITIHYWILLILVMTIDIRSYMQGFKRGLNA